MMVQTILEICVLAGSAGLMVFCLVLARRLRRLNDLETGLGGAIAVMTAEIDRMEQSIRSVKTEAERAGEALAEQIHHAQTEQARWNLHRQMHQVTMPEPPRPAATKLRKRRVDVDA